MRKFGYWFHGIRYGTGSVLLLIFVIVPLPREYLFTEVFWILVGVDLFGFFMSFQYFRRMLRSP